MQPRLVLRLFLFLCILGLVRAAACPAPALEIVPERVSPPTPSATSEPASAVIIASPDPHNVTVVNALTGQRIAQFPATDGGSGIFNGVIWIVFSVIVGLPLGTVGVRMGRIATGAAVGLSMAFAVWAAFVNTLLTPFTSNPKNADLILTIIVLITFSLFSFFGMYVKALHPYGLALLGACGGASFFMRLAVLRAGLLVPVYAVNIILIILGVIAGVFAILWNRRLGVILSTALIATFLGALALDMIFHMKSPPGEGMSRGLRLLLDRNPSHSADLFDHPFVPTMTTQVIIGISFGLVPTLAFLQHRLFPGHFHYTLHPIRESIDVNEKAFDGNDLFRPDIGVGGQRKYQISLPLRNPPNWTLNRSRFSLE